MCTKSSDYVNSQGYYLDEWLICALNQVKFGTYVSDTYTFAYLISQLATWLGDLPDFDMGQNNQFPDFYH